MGSWEVELDCVEKSCPLAKGAKEFSRSDSPREANVSDGEPEAPSWLKGLVGSWAILMGALTIAEVAGFAGLVSPSRV